MLCCITEVPNSSLMINTQFDKMSRYTTPSFFYQTSCMTCLRWPDTHAYQMCCAFDNTVPWLTFQIYAKPFFHSQGKRKQNLNISKLFPNFGQSFMSIYLFFAHAGPQLKAEGNIPAHSNLSLLLPPLISLCLSTGCCPSVLVAGPSVFQ